MVAVRKALVFPGWSKSWHAAARRQPRTSRTEKAEARFPATEEYLRESVLVVVVDGRDGGEG